MSWDKRYRRLEAGEIIQVGDEVDACKNGWKDAHYWLPARCIGEHAPDPAFPAHRIYRRPVAAEQTRLEESYEISYEGDERTEQ